MSPRPTHEHLFLPVGAPLWQEVRCPCGLHRSLVASTFVYRLAGKTYDVPPKCEGPRPMRVHADRERETTAQRWRKLGLCVSCGDKVTTTATTGEPSIYCQAHLVAGRKRNARANGLRKLRQDPMPWARKAAS